MQLELGFCDIIDHNAFISRTLVPRLIRHPVRLQNCMLCSFMAVNQGMLDHCYYAKLQLYFAWILKELTSSMCSDFSLSPSTSFLFLFSNTGGAAGWVFYGLYSHCHCCCKVFFTELFPYFAQHTESFGEFLTANTKTSRWLYRRKLKILFNFIF